MRHKRSRNQTLRDRKKKGTTKEKRHITIEKINRGGNKTI